MLQQIIQLVAILFLLSMVCERIADFLKHHLSDRHLFKIQKDFFKVGNTLTKFPKDDAKEQERVFRILKINVASGILLAIFMNADLIQMLHNIENPSKTLGWGMEDWYVIKNWEWYEYFLRPLRFIIGVTLTGCFISFGSKFWHDLLDILYQIKNTKRVLAEPETYKVDNTKALEELFDTYQSDFIKAAYLDAKTKYMAMDSVKAIGIKSDDEGYYFEITADKNIYGIEPFYEHLLNDGKLQKIRIKIVELLDGDSIRALNLNLSAKVFDMKKSSSWGTIGVVVKLKNDQSSKKYLLTCCHNVIEPFGVIDEHNRNSVDVGVIYSNVETQIGTVYKAFIDHEVDAALIEITPENQNLILNSVPQMGYIKDDYRELKDNERNVRTSIYGANTYGEHEKSSKGIVNSLYHTIEIDYDKYRDKKITMMNLIQISNKALEGDSGSCVVDNNCRLLGLVVAGSDEVTYMMPIKTLLTKLNVQIA